MTTATTNVVDRPDTTEMVVVHDCFRRIFTDLPGLIRGVPAGDVERAGVVLELLTEVSTGLHHHHTAEDELLWPRLLQRAEPDAALILRMEEQHERVDELMQRAEAAAATFGRTAAVADGEQLASMVEQLYAGLHEHLVEEEQHILPLVERVLSLAEWNELGERGRASMPKDRLLIQLGYILLGQPRERRRAFLAEMPPPVRLAWRLLGRRRFTREYRRIYLAEPPLG